LSVVGMYGTLLEYFPGEYRWSAALRMALGAAQYGGGEAGEIDRVGRRLMERIGNDEAWYAEWKGMGQYVEALGSEAEEEGHDLTAAGCYLRACNYYQIGERFLNPKDEDALQVYLRSVSCFQKAAKLLDGPIIEAVEVPFEDRYLPAYYVTSTEGGRKPAVVYFDGLDVNKEILYFSGVPDLV
jgi:hypothetical protein